MKRILIALLACLAVEGCLLTPSDVLAANYPQKFKLLQEQMGYHALVGANPAGDIVFVNSTSGASGNAGESPRHAVNSIARALAIASAGDTIVVEPGGSETVTATIAANLARVRIVCPTENPDSGYTITGAGTIDLMTVSAADVVVKGLKFVPTGATHSAAGILTTAAADRLHVENCVFDASGIVTNFTGFGVEITDDTDDTEIVGCRFKDCHRGVLFATSTGKYLIDARIEACTFWVGRATAFGIYSAPAGTGTVTGLSVKGCVFVEANGDGGAATDAWDGSDGTNAASGPISLGAAVDQYVIADSRAYTALAVTFANIQAINAGAAGDITECETGTSSDSTTLIGAINDATTDSLHGKLGTDTELADNSIYDLLGSGCKATDLSTAVAAVQTEADKIGTLVNAGGTATLGGMFGDMANSPVVTRFANLQTEADKIGTVVNAGGTATIGAILGDFANTDLVTRVAAIKTEADKIGTVVNAGGTATLGGVLGDFANVSAVTRFANLQTQADKLGTITNAGGTATVGGVFGDFANTTLIGHLGTLNGTTTESLHGKLGTDTEYADRSVFDILVGDGPVAFPAAAAAANDVSFAEVIRYIQESQIGTLVNAGGTATLGGMFGDMANSSVVTRFGNIQTEVDKIGTVVNAGGTATIGAVFGDMANSPVVTRFGNIQTEVNKIGTLVNAGGTATLGGMFGDMANTPVVTRFGTINTATGNIQTEVDKIGTIVNAGGTATIGAIFGDFANSSLVTRVGNIQTEVDKIGTIVNAGGTATVGGVFGDMANSPVVTRFGNIQTEVNKIGTVVNAGGTATVGAILGDFANTTLVGKLGTIDSATTDNLHGKIGTDAQMGDNSLWDYLVPVTATGEADIDISEADYTTYITLLTITPAANQPLIDLVVDFDYNKTTTGWDNVSTAADTLDMVAVTKVDGTNYRTIANGTQVTANGDESLEMSENGDRFNIGMISVAGTVQFKVKLSVERADAEIPYRVTYRGAAPTITPVALP